MPGTLSNQSTLYKQSTYASGTFGAKSTYVPSTLGTHIAIDRYSEYECAKYFRYRLYLCDRYFWYSEYSRYLRYL